MKNTKKYPIMTTKELNELKISDLDIMTKDELTILRLNYLRSKKKANLKYNLQMAYLAASGLIMIALFIYANILN